MLRFVLFSVLFFVCIVLFVPVFYSGFLFGFPVSGVGGFETVVFYYGWLYPGLENISMNIIVVSGTASVLPGGSERPVVDALLARGVEVYAYLHNISSTGGSIPVGLGSTYNATVVNGNWSDADFVSYIESLVDQYRGNFTGVFLDECDPSYFGVTDPANPFVVNFTHDLGEIVAYAHSIGLKVMINGVRAYAGLGDYYLWEDFLTGYNSTTGEITVESDFYTASSSNPYDWVNGITKYEYLRDNGLLGRTIALTIIEPGNYTLAEAGYYAARILGLAGWAYADVNIFASGSPVEPIHAFPLGVPLTPPVLDVGNNSMARVFSSGLVSVNLSSGLYRTPFDGFVWDPIVDGVLDNVYNYTSGLWSGSNSSILGEGIFASENGVYLYYNISFNIKPIDTGILHIYIDIDNSNATGFRTGSLGADYMVEAYSNGGAILYRYNGSGTDWNWTSLGAATMALVSSSNGLNYTLELMLPPSLYNSTASYQAWTIVNWSDDAVAPVQRVNLTLTPPSIYSLPGSLPPRIMGISFESYMMRAVCDAPSGTLARYSFVVPFRSVSDVRVNGTSIPRVSVLPLNGEAYSVEPGPMGTLNVTVQVLHHSPVVIVVYGVHPVGGSLVGSPVGGLTSDYYYIIIIMTLFILILFNYKIRKINYI